jgi:hypothetical protein
MLYATGWRGLPVILFIWCIEAMLNKSDLAFPAYVFFSVIGILCVLVGTKVPSRSEATEYLVAHQGQFRNVVSSGNMQDSSIRSDLLKDDSEYALSSFDGKLKRAERDLMAARAMKESTLRLDDAGDEDVSETQPETDDAEDQGEVLQLSDSSETQKAGPRFTGSQSESAEEVAIFGQDPFASEAPGPATTTGQTGGAGSVSGMTPGQAVGDQLGVAADISTIYGANSSTTDSAQTDSQPGADLRVAAQPPSPDLSTITTSPMFDPDFAARTAKVLDSIDSMAFETVNQDSAGQAALQADQLTAAFSAENATASAGLLDQGEQSSVGSLINNPPVVAPQPEVPLPIPAPVPVLAGAPPLPNPGVQSAPVSSSVPSPGGLFGTIPGLGSLPGYDNSNLLAGLGTVPGSPASNAASNAADTKGESGKETAQKRSVCPKCGADLNGQFSFCLSCLAIL